VPLSILGYVLDPPRVGGSNAPFTMTPNVYVYDQIAFDAAYPSDESSPRTEYHVFVLVDPISAISGTGPGGNGALVDARFAWTKNEVIQRFDYEGSEGRFKTLPGAALIVVGTLVSDSNTTRLKVLPPTSTNLASYPIRISLGTGSGQTFTVTLVLNDAAFTNPPSGSVQLSLATGNLNWNTTDLVTYLGQSVRFQRQSFYAYKDSSGDLGLINNTLLLNPLPGTGQFPLVRIGFGEYLTPVERITEAGFSIDPSLGTVEWASNTGRLKFNSTDTTNNLGRSIYYDGVAFGWDVTVLTGSVGTVTSPGVVWPLPPEASDTFFQIPGVVQFPETQFVDVLTSPGKKGVVQIRRSDGRVGFSSADQARYGATAVWAVIADLIIERGMKLRLFRTPVNLDDTDGTLQDVSAFYTSSNAIWASPIIASPTVELPAVPVDTRPLQIQVLQGTGTFTSSNFPRLDVATPPAGLGYILDYEAQQFLFAQRKSNTLIQALTPYGGVQLPDPLVFDSNLVLEVETSPGGGTFSTLVIGESALVDFPSGLVTIVATDGTLVTSGVGASFLGTLFTDATKNFAVAGVVQGNRLVVLAGPSEGVYSVSTVGTSSLTTDVPGATSTGLGYSIHAGVEILADRYFYEVPQVDPNTSVERIRSLGMITNSPRLSLDLSKVGTTRFRFGKTVFSTSVVLVSDDVDFTTPTLLLPGVVEISQATGHLNFSQSDVTAGGLVYSVWFLTLGSDYSLQPPLGFVQLAERMLVSEEALVTYKNSDGDIVQERVTFLVRKEKLVHLAPTSTMSFNPEGHEAASIPTPKAFRGGRPQTSSQVQADVSTSTITFVEVPTVTNALPSGPIVDPSENVYLDYYLYEAIGGEQNFTILQPPMQGVVITITADTNNFYIAGDRTSIFTSDALLLVEGAELYSVGSSTYDSLNQWTNVVLAGPQLFMSGLNNPKLSISSGRVRTIGSPLLPSYFLTDMTAYDVAARGSSILHLHGDVARTYIPGVVLLFSDVGYTDYYLVSGSTYNKDTGKTDVTLTTESFRQYDGVPIKRSVRPVLPTPSASLVTSRSPELGQPLTLYRRVEGAVGVLLSSPEDYKIDASGTITLTEPLTLDEEIGAFYTGDTIIEAGRRFRASYTFGVAPTESNGLLNQILVATYTTYIPDTFFWRVETFTNFRGELAEAYTAAAQASVPTAGPVLSNSSQPNLWEQGRESLYYEEGYLSNEDLVARPTLKYYNDATNYLENVLQYMDGRVVGDHDGRFLFDGSIDNPYRTTFASVTNQIDDVFKVSPAPYSVSGPPFVTVSIGTYREVYKAAATSRFYPTHRSRYGATVDPVGLEVGDPLLDTGTTNLTSVKNLQRRFPWAMVTAKAVIGDTTLYVDDADGSTDLLRPAFSVNMRVAIIDQNGTVLVPDASSLILGGVSPTSLTVPALSVTVPKGATVRLATNDTVYYKTYRLGIDLAVDLEKGLLTYLDPSDPAWAILSPSVPAAGEALDMVVTMNNLLTAPDRFPALDGATTDDDGGRGFPVLTPSVASETAAVGYIPEVLRIVNSATGTLTTATTPSFVGVGDLDGTGAIITNTGGTWLSPVPQLYDLVDIRTGPNSPSTYRIIISVGASTITVSSAFPVPGDTGFTFTVTSGTNLASGTANISPSTNLNDPTADFNTAGVKPGHTIVITTGVITASRRQIVAVASPTDLTIEALPITGSFGYRVVNSLATYGKVVGSITVDDWVPALIGLYGALSSNTSPLAEIPSIDAFFNTVFTDITTGSNGVSNNSTFSATGQTFLLDNVSTTNLLFIRSGTVAGVYKIQSIDAEDSLTIEGTFPVNTTGVIFRIVNAIGLSAEGLAGVLTALLEAETFAASLPVLVPIITTAITVSGDAGAYATRLLGSDRTTHESQLNTRLTQVSLAITNLTGELSSGDRLYDKRYTWIDSRINLMNGILSMRELAVANRIKAQQDVLNQLTKLLSVRT
jgi:hypothetical protein